MPSKLHTKCSSLRKEKAIINQRVRDSKKLWTDVHLKIRSINFSKFSPFWQNYNIKKLPKLKRYTDLSLYLNYRSLGCAPATIKNGAYNFNVPIAVVSLPSSKHTDSY